MTATIGRTNGRTDGRQWIEVSRAAQSGSGPDQTEARPREVESPMDQMKRLKVGQSYESIIIIVKVGPTEHNGNGNGNSFACAKSTKRKTKFPLRFNAAKISNKTNGSFSSSLNVSLWSDIAKAKGACEKRFNLCVCSLRFCVCVCV